jgi:glyoxylase-like metal-dependent hydrolase (beta-lactamase superfamily II)
MPDGNRSTLEIVGAESLGVRSLCCAVDLEDRRILIDPGLALGYFRHGQHPHPVQVAIGERVRRRILTLMEQATDVIFSHFHGDHVPLTHANTFQLLEAWRDRLYHAFPVPDGWMDEYAHGRFDVEPFLESALARGVIPPLIDLRMIMKDSEESDPRPRGA